MNNAAEADDAAGVANDPGEEYTAGTLLGQADWQPRYLAEEMKRYVRYYR